MRRLDAAEVVPGVKHGAALRVVACEVIVQRGIPAALVAVVPEEDGRMVYIAQDEFAHELCAYLRVVGVLPSGQFVQDEKAERVGGIKEMRIRGVV